MARAACVQVILRTTINLRKPLRLGILKVQSIILSVTTCPINSYSQQHHWFSMSESVQPFSTKWPVSQMLQRACKQVLEWWVGFIVII